MASESTFVVRSSQSWWWHGFWTGVFLGVVILMWSVVLVAGRL